MKKVLAPVISVALIILISFHFISSFEQQNSKKRLTNNSQIEKQSHVKKVYYADGEYEKEYKRWNIVTKELYIKISENMISPFEQIVVQNYLQYSKEFSTLWEELIKIEPTNNFKNIHNQLILEAKNGATLCDSYVNNIKEFDSNFKYYFISHQKNQIRSEKN